MKAHSAWMTAALLALAVSPAETVTINVDLGTAHGPPPDIGGAGPLGKWNSVGLGTTPLVDNADEPSGASITVTADSDGGVHPDPADDNLKLLLYDNIYTQDGTWSANLSGLPADTYCVVYYAPSHPSVSTGIVTINGENFSSIPGTGSGNVVLGQSHLPVITKVSSSGALNVSGSGGGFVGLAGLQIDPTGSLDFCPPPAATIGIVDVSSATFFLNISFTGGPATFTFQFGAPGPGRSYIFGDWDASADASGERIPSPNGETVGLYDMPTGAFFLRNNNTNGPADHTFFFGPPNAGWVPLAGDWNDDGIDTIGLYDPVNGVFYLRNSNTNGPADFTFFFGPAGAGWLPVTGDWNGDGADAVGLFDPVNGAFFLRDGPLNGPADHTFFFGPPNSGWTPLAGDWDADGTDTVGLYDPVNGVFFGTDVHANGPAGHTAVYGGTGPNIRPIAADWEGE